MVKKAILIIGMHRTGSSVLAGLLHRAGLDLGKELLPPLPENPKGFYENTAFYHLNEKLLDLFNSSWSEIEIGKTFRCDNKTRKLLVDDIVQTTTEQFQSSQFFCIKDPRITLLFDYYHQAFSKLGIEVVTINCTRNIIEISKSLNKRNLFKMSYAFALSLYYARRASALKKRHRIIDIDYRETLKEPGSVLEKIKEFGHLQFNIEPEMINEFVSQDLYRNKSLQGSLLLYIRGYLTFYRIKIKKWIQSLL